MTGPLTRTAYEAMIAEDIAWLDAQPHTLEREHVRAIVARSAVHEYSAARVVAAAVQTGDDLVTHSLPPPARHHHVIRALGEADYPSEESWRQGFLLSDGTFATRREALLVARAAGQVLRETGPHIGLFSEDVW